MQFVTTILNRCAQFDRTVTYGEDVLKLADESAPRAVESLYWGLAHGYALDRASGRGWFGSPVGGRWTWEPQPAALEAVRQLIAIQRDQADPVFVSVPARLADPTPLTR